MKRLGVVRGHIDETVARTADVSATACAGGNRPVKVAVTGAAGQIAYSLLIGIARGNMLGPDQPVILQLLDIPPAKQALTGVVMELEDCAFPLVHGIRATTDPMEAFYGAEIALLVGGMPRKQGMLRKDLLTANAAIFKVQGKALNDVADRNVKVCVVANPCNTNALIVQQYAPDLPKENITAMTRLDENRAVAQVAKRLGCKISDVSNVAVWGNHSATQYPDVSHAVARTSAGLVNVRKAIGDDEWLAKTLIPTVQQRGAAIIKARKLSSAASAANAVCDHVHDWILGTLPGCFASMAVPSDGSYGIAPGIVYSFPVTCANGTYQIVQGLEIDAFSRKLMEKTRDELVQERETALSFLA